MSAMENRDEVLQMLERFTRLKQKEIPRELEDYLSFVARTGDTVYPWPAVKYFFRTKLSHVIMDFHDNTPSIADLPQCPNVDPFCYDRMKRTLLSRMESFNSAPFTIQRICELLNEPRKHYTRIDKFMRAVEKNILVVSTQEPGRRRSDSENGDSLDSIVNGDLEVNVDIEMDNEAFGIDSNEMVPNATAPATEAPVSSTTSARVDDVPPMESSEEQEQEAENHEPVIIPEVALTVTDGVDTGEITHEPKTEEAIPKEVDEHPKDDPEIAQEAPAQTEKLLYPDDVEPASPETCAPDSKEEPLSDAIDSAEPEILKQSEQNEVPPPESHTIEPAAADEQPSNAMAPEDESDSIDEGEPKAKMAKISHEESESEATELKDTTVPAEKSPTDPEKDTVSSESTTDSNGSSVEYLDCNISPEDRSESGVDLAASSAETVANTISTSVGSIISSEEYPESSENVLSIPSDSTLVESSTSVPTTDEVPPVEQEKQDERPAEQSAEEPQKAETTPETPSESAEPEQPEEETIVRRINLEVADESEPPTAPVASTDEMETAIVPENVMATDEEEQPQLGSADAVVPMAADASETVKPDENAMDIDESSVEPMDQ